MDLYNLECFLTVAEEMSISKAARKMFLSQQTMSSIIQRLETEYHCKLFDRKPSFRLTPKGLEMQRFGYEIMRSHDRMCHAMEQSESESIKGVLKIGMSHMRVDAFFPEIWRRFHEKYPRIAVEIRDGRSRALQKAVLDGNLSICFGLNIKTNNGLKVEEYTMEYARCCISASLLRKYHPELTEADLFRMTREGIEIELLKGIPCISERIERGREHEANEAFSILAEENLIVRCDHQSTVFRLAKMGYGFGSLFPIYHYLHQSEINQPGGDLWVFPLRFTAFELMFGVAYAENWSVPKYAQDFLKIAREVIENYVSFAQKTNAVE